MVFYDRILQTGLQSLLAVACGWGCGRWRLVDAEPTVQYVNHLVLKFCIPCLQIWLLAFKTDMQQAENWRALAAFLAWSLGLQALLLLHQLVTQQRLHLDRLGVDGLILTTNNTGILGPVVLEAAVGSRYAPLGMLATVALYFQQLPLAQLLFQLHQQQHQQQQHQQQLLRPAARLPAAAATAAVNADEPVPAAATFVNSASKVATSPEPSVALASPGASQACSRSSIGVVLQFDSGHHMSQLRHLHHPTGQQQPQQQQQAPSALPLQVETPLLRRQQQPAFGSAGTLQVGQHAPQQQQQQHQQQWRRLSWDLEQQQQHQQQQRPPGQAVLGCEAAPLLAGSVVGPAAAPLQQDIAAYSLSLLIKNPLVWSTAIPLMLSALGSSALLDPSSPLAIKQLAFLEACLAWFAQATAPLTLFTTGLWMCSNSQQHQDGQGSKRHASDSGLYHTGEAAGSLSGQANPPSVGAGPTAAAAAAAGVHLSGQQAAFGSKGIPWAVVLRCLLLRATLAPGFMVLVCWLMGFRGDLAHALVILALLPVAQTAFVVCKQAEVGMAAVALMLVASLLVMIPQLMVVLAVLERLGLLA